jgi:hypothetical protein
MTYESVLLQRIDELIGELDGVFSARSLSALLGHCQGAWLPLASCTATYGEKTCCETSEEGFEFSAPILVCWRAAGCWRLCAMMRLLGEVEAHAWPTKGR